MKHKDLVNKFHKDSTFTRKNKTSLHSSESYQKVLIFLENTGYGRFEVGMGEVTTDTSLYRL